jgi:type 1 glutamine amidotransferase
MKNKIVLNTAIALLIAMNLGCTSGTRSEKRMLVYTRNGEGYVHDNIENSVKALQKLGTENDILVDVSDDPAVFKQQNLEQYSCIVFSNTNNDVFDTDSQKVAFMRYIQAGGGFVGIHSACGTERNWPWFIRLLGGTFEVHAVYQEFYVDIVDPGHPSTRHLPDPWLREDECYFLKDMNPDIHVLIRHDLSTIEDERKEFFVEEYGMDFPGAWYHEFEGGRSWFTSYGHKKEDYDDPLFMDHILGGIIYAMGDNKKLDYSKATATKP